MRTYRATPGRVEDFTQFFLEHLYPSHEDHGARLVGRWHTDDDRIVAIFEYDDIEHFAAVDAAVQADPRAADARVRREELGQLFESYEEVFMHSTLPAGLGFVAGRIGGEGPPGRLPT